MYHASVGLGISLAGSSSSGLDLSSACSSACSRSVVRILLLLLPEWERMLEPPDHWLPLLMELDDAPGLPAASMLELKSEFSDMPVLSDQLLACI